MTYQLTEGLSHTLVHIDGISILHELPDYLPLVILYYQHLLRLGHTTDHHQTNLHRGWEVGEEEQEEEDKEEKEEEDEEENEDEEK